MFRKIYKPKYSYARYVFDSIMDGIESAINFLFF